MSSGPGNLKEPGRYNDGDGLFLEPSFMQTIAADRDLCQMIEEVG
jgi:hypothetical protein